MARNACHVLEVHIPFDEFSDGPSNAGGSDQDAMAFAPLLLVSDKASTLTGLHIPQKRGQRNDAVHVFEAILPRCITRLRHGSVRPPWRTSPPGMRPLGVIDADILGSASDGSVFAISILDEHAWRLLRYLLNMCRQAEPVRSSLSESDYSKEIDPDAETAYLKRKEAYHIDGDQLSRLLKEDPRAAILDALGGDGKAEGMKERCLRFKELAEAALGSEEDLQCTGENMLYLINKVEEWLQQVLMPVF